MEKPYGEIIGEIAYRYFLIRQYAKNKPPPNALESMIDIACNYSPTIDDTKEVIKQFKMIVKLKKQIGHDFNTEQKTIEELKTFLKK